MADIKTPARDEIEEAVRAVVGRHQQIANRTAKKVGTRPERIELYGQTTSIVVALLQTPEAIHAANEYTGALCDVNTTREQVRSALIKGGLVDGAAWDSPLRYDNNIIGTIDRVVLRDPDFNPISIPRYPVNLQVGALLKSIASKEFTTPKRNKALTAITKVLGVGSAEKEVALDKVIRILGDDLEGLRNEPLHPHSSDVANTIAAIIEQNYDGEPNAMEAFMRDLKELPESLLPNNNPLKQYNKPPIEDARFTEVVVFLQIAKTNEIRAKKRLELMVENAVSTTDLPDMREADRDDMKREVLEMIKDISMYGYLGAYIKKVPQAVPPGTTALVDPPATEKPFPDQVIAAVEAMKADKGAPIERTNASLPTRPGISTPYLG